VLLFAGEQTKPAEAKTISPVFETKVKAETFSISWMIKHPDGMP